jgi:hypothetical protein
LSECSFEAERERERERDKPDSLRTTPAATHWSCTYPSRGKHASDAYNNDKTKGRSQFAGPVSGR